MAAPPEIGYALSSEEHSPRDLVRYARIAEERGFTYALISDHFLRSVTMFWLPEREHIWGGAGLEERDLQRALADRVVLAHELVQAAFGEQAVPVLGDVDAV